MQVKLHLNGSEELTLTTFNMKQKDELNDLRSLFGKLLQETEVNAYFLDHENTKVYRIYKQVSKKKEE